MNITIDTKVHDLVETYPYLLDWLVARDSHFENLRNPALFETMARLATLERAAQMAGVDPEGFVDEIKTQVACHSITEQERAGLSAIPGPPAGPQAQERQELLKQIVRRLHDGEAPDSVKADFDSLVRDVDSTEIARMEQAIIAEGTPVEDVQRLCDVHVAVFKESLDEKPAARVEVGHPLDAYRRENVIVTDIVGELRNAVGQLRATQPAEDRSGLLADISAGLTQLEPLAVHYQRKELQLFPALEAHDVTGPTKVMWALDDDIRDRLKTARTLLDAGDAVSLARLLDETLKMVDDMVYKEEKILFPTALSVITESEWQRMAEGDAEIGFAWVDGFPTTPPAETAAPSKAPAASPTGELLLPLPTGSLTLAQLDVLFRALPFDLTFVDENDRVRFYSEGERVFPRSPGVIGREVRNCHPPKSLHKVEQIVSEFKAGTKDVAEFWIQMAEKFVHIRYFALRDEDGSYKGTLEIVQDASHVRALEGERRIVDW
jgi:DUF438 domain-containing protein